ncbi:hypothetical protein [Streptomyces sp. NPDC005302]|uniref:hypothetical protein n=1 Tax=Streptomyces sp. NPDC005302 TaxID=3154675 RepID=UPI0033B3DE60
MTQPEPIRAPWTSEQVAALNACQQRGGMPPFTCGREVHPAPLVLLAHRDGWHCSDPDCDYRQDWAHAFMADPSVWPAVPVGVSPPAALTDQAAVLNAAAQHLYTALFPAVYDDLGQKAAEGVNRAVSELRRLADIVPAAGLHGEVGETQHHQPQAEAHPPAVTWQIEAPRRDTWTRWSAPRDTRDEAREDYDRVVAWGGGWQPFRLVRADTTYTVEAEHQPAVVSQPDEEPAS